MMRTEAGVKPWLEKNLLSALSSTSHARFPTYSVLPGETDKPLLVKVTGSLRADTRAIYLIKR